MRANLLVYFEINGAALIASYLLQGVFDARIFALALIVGPTFGIALAIGTYFFRGASDTLYRNVAYAIVALSAVVGVPYSTVYCDTLRTHLGDERIRHFKIRVNILHIVMLVEHVDEFQHLLTLLVVDCHRVLRFPDQRRLARLAEFRFQRLGDVAKGSLRRVNLMPALAGHDIVGAGIDAQLRASHRHSPPWCRTR